MTYVTDSCFVEATLQTLACVALRLRVKKYVNRYFFKMLCFMEIVLLFAAQIGKGRTITYNISE